MKLLTAEMKMADAIHYNYLLIPVISRFGIKLGFGDKTIHTLCQDHHIDTEFFLTILNTFSNKNYFPEKRLQKFNVIQFIDYLRKTHRYYINVQVPIIEKHIHALIENSVDNSGNLKLVKNFFNDYKLELTEHLNREEVKTFPYIETIYDLYNGTFDEEKFQVATRNYSMKKFSEEHDNIDDKLFDLQNILIKYLNGNFNEDLTHAVLFELFRMEKDIKNHTRLEEMILGPMVEEMELQLKSHIQ